MAEKVAQGESAADIGTDHGYVPMILVRENKSSFVIMSDISADSLAKARETFTISGFLELSEFPDLTENETDLNNTLYKCDFRVGDGLDTIEPGEVDDVIIGGLGGLTIIDILNSDIAKSRSYRKLILQPRKHSGNLRYYLYTHGWDIIDEDLAQEGKFVCEIITAVPAAYGPISSQADYFMKIEDAYRPKLRPAPYPESDIRWKYPASIVQASPELAANRISWKIGSIKEQLDNLSHSSSDQRELEKRLESELSYLEDLLEQTDSFH